MIKKLFILVVLTSISIVSYSQEDPSNNNLDNLTPYGTAITPEPASDNTELNNFEFEPFDGGGGGDFPEEAPIDNGILILISAGILVGTLYIRKKIFHHN